MEMGQQIGELDEMNRAVDQQDSVPTCDGLDNDPSDSNLMNDLHSILTLSLIFYERLVRPLRGVEQRRWTSL
jgi:hypothetical protein